MPRVLPPANKQFTADNSTGANIVPGSDCETIIIQDIAANPTLDFNVTITGTVTRQAGFRYVITAKRGTTFFAGTVIGTILAATTGTITFGQEEY